jgi:signal transduction histidine kinase
MPRSNSRYTMAALGTAILLVGIYAAMVIWFRSDLRAEIHQKILERDAAVLYPMALQQVADSEANGSSDPLGPLTALLKSAQQRGMLAVSVFDRDGNTIEAVPTNQLFVELPTEDYLQLQAGRQITRYHPSFPLDQYFVGVSTEHRQAPVLEVLLAVPGQDASSVLGFVRYFIDARPISSELAIIDQRIDRQTAVTLAVGAVLTTLVVAGAALTVRTAQKTIAERNDRLARANLELALSTKASAIGQIASHLIHGLQGSVAGLKAVVASREPSQTSTAWEIAAGYTERLQSMIQETVALLGDANAHASYELTGREIASIIRDRNGPTATDKGVSLEVAEGFDSSVDSHRGSLLCMIANNLVQNSIMASEPGRKVAVSLTDAGGTIVLTVRDEGAGIPDAVRAHLFKPGRSGRSGGSGLGLAISRLLAQQIGAELVLLSTGPAGTTFTLTLPRGSP